MPGEMVGVAAESLLGVEYVEPGVTYAHYSFDVRGREWVEDRVAHLVDVTGCGIDERLLAAFGELHIGGAGVALIRDAQNEPLGFEAANHSRKSGE